MIVIVPSLGSCARIVLSHGTRQLIHHVIVNCCLSHSRVDLLLAQGLHAMYATWCAFLTTRLSGILLPWRCRCAAIPTCKAFTRYGEDESPKYCLKSVAEPIKDVSSNMGFLSACFGIFTRQGEWRLRA